MVWSKFEPPNERASEMWNMHAWIVSWAWHGVIGEWGVHLVGKWGKGCTRVLVVESGSVCKSCHISIAMSRIYSQIMQLNYSRGIGRLSFICSSESDAPSFLKMHFSEWTYFSYVSPKCDATANVWCEMTYLVYTQLIYYTLVRSPYKAKTTSR